MNLYSLRVFGCRAMAHVPNEKRNKLDERSIECIFLGYGSNTSGYRLDDPIQKKIILSRDVIFLENERRREENSLVVTEEEKEHIKGAIPTAYEEAMSCVDAEKWKAAMDAEYDALIENKTWAISEPPEERKIVGNGKILRYKARLVVKGFSQKSGIDYNETFSPVVRYSCIRILLALAVKLGLNIRQMDAVCAYIWSQTIKQGLELDHKQYILIE